MSNEAVSWVIKQDIARSSEKFVLMCLANYADERGYCYPSAETLVHNTGQDRKTVLANLRRLADGGLIRDTGRRVGRTRGVIVFEITGIPGNSTTHYVYRVTDLATGEFCIGKRSFNGDPSLDAYRGTGKWVTMAAGKDTPLHKEILGTWFTEIEAAVDELQQYKAHHTHPLCRNDREPDALRDRATALARMQAPPGHPSGPDSGTAPDASGSGPVIPPSGPVFPGSGPVIPPKQSRKRDTEPSCKPSEEPSRKKGKGGGAAGDDFDPMTTLLEQQVDAQVARDWLDLRKAKKSPVTRTVLAVHMMEAIKANLTLNDALSLSCSKGWQGFEARFVEPRLQAPQQSGPRGNARQMAVAGQDHSSTQEAMQRSLARSGAAADGDIELS